MNMKDILKNIRENNRNCKLTVNSNGVVNIAVSEDQEQKIVKVYKDVFIYKDNASEKFYKIDKVSSIEASLYTED